MKIFLIGWFGAGNMGDEAILISELLSIRSQIKNVEFYILSFDPKRTKKLTASVPEVTRVLKMGSKLEVIKSDLFGIWKAFRESDAVIIGGGGIFQDIYNHYPIPFFTAMTLLARFHRKPTIFYGIGVGPINTFVGRRLLRCAARSADMIFVRDLESKALLERLGAASEAYLAADPVFLLEPLRSEKVEQLIKTHNLDGNGLVIGLCVQDLLFWSDLDRRILAETLDALNKEKKAKVIFFPFGAYRDGWFTRRTSESVDMVASRRLADLMEREFTVIAPDGLSPQELLALMERIDLVISMRFHGLVMGLSVGVPTIALTHREESKIRNLMKRLDQEDNLFEVSHLEKKKLFNRAEYLLSGPDHVKTQISKMVSSTRLEAETCNELLVKTLMKINCI
jgi:polysaccharide pyruvyl transferase CsaB